jgi:hypothetical protein
MPRGITRRVAARLLLTGPAVLTLPDLVRAEPAAKRPPSKPAFSPAERRQIDKSIAQLRSTVEKVRKVGMPMGSEPAFVFRPLLPKK